MRNDYTIQGGITMFERWYKITGLTKELLTGWDKDLRKDIIIWIEDNNVVQARIRLNPIEAFCMRRRMERNNEEQSYYKLQLIRL